MRRFPFMIALLALAWFAQPAKATPGVDQPFSKTTTEKTWGDHLADAGGFGGFSKSYALVVGISDYAGGYSDLPTADDAKRLASYLFEEAGFDYVRLLTEENVTKDRVAELMSEEIPNLLDVDDRFLFCWSGHGDTRAVAVGDGKAGYLPLWDTEPERWSPMIAMEDVQRWNRFLPARQSLFLLDACFGGLAGVVPQSSPSRNLRVEQLAQSGHHVMSAGTENEQIIASDQWGGSLFTRALLDGLRGDADAATGFERDGIVSLTELKNYVQSRVLHERTEAGWSNQITPQVRDLRVNQGEFFFLADRSIAVAGIDRTTAEADDREIGDKSSGDNSPTSQEIEARLVFDRRVIQKSLNELGYDLGTPDGSFGPRTRKAISAWQRANGYLSTGFLDALQAPAIVVEAERRLASALPTSPEPELPEAPIEPAVGLSPYEPFSAFRDCSLCPEMVIVPPGSFLMGSEEAERKLAISQTGEQVRIDSEQPRHPVTIFRSFAVGVNEVTFDEWDACLADGGCNGYEPPDEGWGRGKRLVMNVSWNDIEAYISWLSEKTGKTYRLLSEAEWEYAARAGTSTKYWWGDAVAQLNANFGERVGKTTEVGSYEASPWGIHEMLGNFWEIVEDCAYNSYAGAPQDGTAWVVDGCTVRAVRGGGFGSHAAFVRSATRGWLSSTDYRERDTGFRVARDLQ